MTRWHLCNASCELQALRVCLIFTLQHTSAKAAPQEHEHHSALNVMMDGDCTCNWTLVSQDACILCTDQSRCVIRNRMPSHGNVVHIVLWVTRRNVPTLNTLLRRPPGFPNFGAGGPGAGGFSMPPNFGGPAAQSSPVDTTARTVGACHDKHCAATLGCNCISWHALHHPQEQPGSRKGEET